MGCLCICVEYTLFGECVCHRDKSREKVTIEETNWKRIDCDVIFYDIDLRTVSIIKLYITSV